MQIIKDLASYIDEELGDSQKYVKQALCWKDKNLSLAQMFFQLSLEEMDHMNRLHNKVVKLIDEKKKELDYVPTGMEAAYDILHERMIEWAKEIKIMQAMFKE